MPEIFIDIFTVLVLLAAGQALFLIMLLLSFGQKDALPNLLLSLLLFDFSIELLGTTLGTSGLYLRWPHLIRLTEPLIFLYGPILYLYVRSLTGQKLGLGALLHFIPFLFAFIWLFPFYNLSGAEKISFVQTYFLSQEWVYEVFLMMLLRLGHLALYVWLAFQLIRRYEQALKNLHANLEDLSLRWVNQLLKGFALVIGISLLTYVLMFAGVMSLLESNIASSIMVACVIYATGYLGLRQARLRIQRSFQEKEFPDSKTASSPKELLIPEEKIAASLHLLNQKMEVERLYTRNDLSLHILAKEIGLQPYQLSQLLNWELKQSFFDYVNHYRVEEIKRRLENPQDKVFTILALAMDAGFNSKSAFNDSFKKHTGLTPSAYRRQSQEHAKK